MVEKENPCLDLVPAFKRMGLSFLAAGRHHSVELSQAYDVYTWAVSPYQEEYKISKPPLSHTLNSFVRLL